MKNENVLPIKTGTVSVMEHWLLWSLGYILTTYILSGKNKILYPQDFESNYCKKRLKNV